MSTTDAKTNYPMTEVKFQRAGALEPRLSVIVTVYNSFPYLITCLKSLSRQPLNTLEVIIVVDGSNNNNDRSVINDYRNSFISITYLSNITNMGTGYSREVGIKYARGQYIGFLDADDYVAPNAFSSMLATAAKYNADIVVSNYIKTDQWNLSEKDKSDIQPPTIEIISGRELFDTQISREDRPYYLRIDWWNKIYRKSLFTDNNIVFPRVVRNEGTMSMILSLLATRVAITDEVCFYTTTRAESVCRSFRPKNITDIATSILHFRKWLIRLDELDKYYNDYIRLFYFVLLNHNIKLINKLRENEQRQALNLLRESIHSCSTLWSDFLLYCSLRDKSIERLLFATIESRHYNSQILRLANKQQIRNIKSSPRATTTDSDKNRLLRPKITIITITYNLIDNGRKEAFSTMMSSIAEQPLRRHDIEHIIIDGGSTDSTLQLLYEYYNRGELQYIRSEPDNGIYEAMNRGILCSRGEYIIFMNSDDYFTKNGLNSLYQAALQTGKDYVFGDAIKVNKDGLQVGSHKGNINKVFFGSPYCHQAVLCSRRCFDLAYFDTSYKITMWKQALNLYLAGYTYAHISEAVACFRVGGVSTNNESQKFFVDEQTRIKREHVVSKLPISMDEYEFLNYKFRRWDLSKFSCSESTILGKLATHTSEFSIAFLNAYTQLTERRS